VVLVILVCFCKSSLALLFWTCRTELLCRMLDLTRRFCVIYRISPLS
jgi:hypothetical protein